MKREPEYILTSKSSTLSAKLLRDALDKKIIITSEIRNRKPLIRYGNSASPFEVDTNLNSPDFIRLVSNKKLLSDFLLGNGFYVPKFTKDIPEKFPVVVRKKLSSFKGKGIVICESIDEWNQYKNFYWTEWVDISTEFRVHVLGKTPIKAFKKLFAGDNEEKFPVRTSKNYHFSLVSEEGFPKLMEEIFKLTEVLNGEFYAVDVGWDREKKKYFIFEVNSAPGLNNNTALLYAKYLNDKLDKNKEEHECNL